MMTAASGKPGSVSPIFFVVVAAVLFSTGGLFIKLTSISAYELSFGRSLVGAITVALLTRRAGFRIDILTLVGAIFYAALLLLFVMATKLTTAANAIFLQYTAPIYVLLVEPLIFKERYRLRDLLVVACCLAGMGLFFVGQLRVEDVAGNLAALVSGLFFAIFTLLLRRSRTTTINPAAPVIYGNLLLAICTAPAFISGAAELTPKDVAIILYLGIFQIGVAYVFFTLGIARGVRSLDAGIAGYIEPVLNPLWVYMGVGEQPSPQALAGGAIIITAVLAHTVISAQRRAAEGALEG
ncbi:MAG: DMT family transporter [Pyrinomonadaceae bacterium]